MPESTTTMTENISKFNDRIKSFWDIQVNKIRVCYMLAKYAHRHDTRNEIYSTGTPVRYFEHARRVALIVLDELKVSRVSDRASDVICSALLHDCLEDSYTIDKRILENVAGKCVASIVMKLSKKYVRNHMVSDELVLVPHSEYIDGLVNSTDWVVLLVKLCDRLDNMRHLDHCSHAFSKRQAEETETLYMKPFHDLLSRLPAEYVIPATKLVAELEEICEQYA